MSVVTTVLGDIAPDVLGLTSMHEHLAADFSLMAALLDRYGASRPPEQALELRPENLAFLREGSSIFSAESSPAGDPDYTAKELGYFAEAGGRSVCDASPIGLRADPDVLRSASEQSGVQVICATGLYVADARPARYASMGGDEQFAEFAREVREGIGGSGVRPGFLKCALSADGSSDSLQEVELTTLRALARLSADTGLSLHVHTAFPMSAAQVVAALEAAIEAGAAASRIVMMHMDSFLRPWDQSYAYIDDVASTRSVSTDLARRVLDHGAFVGFDSWSQAVPGQPDDDDRSKGLVDLLRRGYGEQIVLGHDVTTKPQGRSYGGWGFTRFPRLVPGVLQGHGFPEQAFHRLAVENPARVLAH